MRLVGLVEYDQRAFMMAGGLDRLSLPYNGNGKIDTQDGNNLDRASYSTLVCGKCGDGAVGGKVQGFSVWVVAMMLFPRAEPPPELLLKLGVTIWWILPVDSTTSYIARACDKVVLWSAVHVLYSVDIVAS